MGKYDTNLASEFYVLSTLHRLGADAVLTLGNKKSVDIVVTRVSGAVVTVDVKGVAGAYDWPVQNVRPSRNGRHFLVLVSYGGRISEPEVGPDVWVIPRRHLKPFLKQYSGRRNVSRALVVSKGRRFRHAWNLILGERRRLTSRRSFISAHRGLPSPVA